MNRSPKGCWHNAHELLAPAYRNELLSGRFAEFLDEKLPDLFDVFDGSGSYAWESHIPPVDQWDCEADKLAKHVASL